VINTGLVAVYQQLSSRIPIHRVLHQMHLGSRWTFLTSYMLLGLSGVLIARFYLKEGSWAALALVAPLVFARQMFMSGRALHVTRSGRPVWVHHKAEVLRDEHGDPCFWQGVVMDISRLKAAEEQVTFMAYHDRLTGLPNRNLFEELLDQALHRARRGGLGVA